MGLNILFFGQLTDFVQKNEINTEYFKDISVLKNYLEKEFPKLKNAEYSISVNRNIINENTALADNDEIALLPPFSGG